MNSLNQLGTRQVASLNADLGKMESGDSGPGVQGKFKVGTAICGKSIRIRTGTGADLKGKLRLHLER